LPKVQEKPEARFRNILLAEILAAKGMGIGLVNSSVIADRMIAGIVAKPFEPAVHFRALILRPPTASIRR